MATRKSKAKRWEVHSGGRLRVFRSKKAADLFALREYGAGRGYPMPRLKKNPGFTIKPGKWIKASAVRVRKVAGRVVMDIKEAI